MRAGGAGHTQTQFQGEVAEDTSIGSRLFKAYLDTVLGNLQLRITNVHVRYEDNVTHPEQVLVCGATLQSLEAFTVDAHKEPTFVATAALQLLRKVTLTHPAWRRSSLGPRAGETARVGC